jgi:formylglycine-generating enzyme required for sulfatase activity
LYDMHGNVWEWCEDYDHANYEADAPADGSPWRSGGDGSRRILRGGSWDSFAYDCRCANRFRYTPIAHGPRVGLRLVAVARQ